MGRVGAVVAGFLVPLVSAAVRLQVPGGSWLLGSLSGTGRLSSRAGTGASGAIRVRGRFMTARLGAWMGRMAGRGLWLTAAGLATMASVVQCPMQVRCCSPKQSQVLRRHACVLLKDRGQRLPS